MIDVGKHFSKQHEEYLNSVSGISGTLYANINKALVPYLDNNILDVGNGGIFTYDTTKARKITAVDIAFRDISRLKKFPNVSYECDDARSLESIPSGSFDVVIYQFTLHHITGGSGKETLGNIQETMKTAMRVLRPGGTVIIVENIIPEFVELFEKLLYKAEAGFLRLFSRPMVYLFSMKTILKVVRESGFKDISHQEILHGEKVDLFSGTKPGLLVIPAWMSPHRCYFFAAKKP
jgi:ubiquinone/menaquinone biosynthesis C-methylase UbiE